MVISSTRLCDDADDMAGEQAKSGEAVTTRQTQTGVPKKMWGS